MRLKFKIVPGYDAYEFWWCVMKHLNCKTFKVGSIRWTQRNIGRCADTPSKTTSYR